MAKQSAFKYPQHANRAGILIAHQRLKMARSAHAYVRGATTKFYEWLEASNGHSIPEGPPIWICGDCHVGNLGPVADVKGKVSIQIRDLDQTVVGNPAHDLIRLGLSLATAARGSDLPGATSFARRRTRRTSSRIAKADTLQAQSLGSRPVDGEVRVPRLVPPFHHARDHARSEEAERHAVPRRGSLP